MADPDLEGIFTGLTKGGPSIRATSAVDLWADLHNAIAMVDLHHAVYGPPVTRIRVRSMETFRQQIAVMATTPEPARPPALTALSMGIPVVEDPEVPPGAIEMDRGNPPRKTASAFSERQLAAIENPTIPCCPFHDDTCSAEATAGQDYCCDDCPACPPASPVCSGDDCS